MTPGIAIIITILLISILYISGIFCGKHANKKSISKNKKIINKIYEILQKKYKLKKKKNTLTGEIYNIPVSIKAHSASITFIITANHYLKEPGNIKNYSNLADYNDIYKIYYNALWGYELSKRAQILKRDITINNWSFNFQENIISIAKKFDFNLKIIENNLPIEKVISNPLIIYINQLILICESTKQSPDIKQRLINNLNQHKDSYIRIDNLKSLIEHFSIDEKLNILLTQLLYDDNQTIQIIAAQNLTDLKKGTDCLLKILEKNKLLSTKDLFSIIDFMKENRVKQVFTILKKLIYQTANPAVHNKIISTLIFFGTHKMYEFFLELLRSSRHLKTDEKLMIIKAIKRKKYLKAIPALIEFYQTAISYQIKNEILNTFTEMEDKSANDFLMQLLKGAESPSIELLDAIAACGDISSIEPLYLLSERTLSSILKNQLKHTIAKIQPRLGSAEKGWVSVSETDFKEGGLSEAKEVQDGAISHLKGEKK